MKLILAIDPGPEQSGFVVWDGKQIIEKGILENAKLLNKLRFYKAMPMVIEEVRSYGMAVGITTFDTVFWTGRFCERWEGSWQRIPRMGVKMHLCGNSRAKDCNIRQAIIDRFGGKEKAIGKKATPGPLYGVKKDIWAALALAITFWELNQ